MLRYVGITNCMGKEIGKDIYSTVPQKWWNAGYIKYEERQNPGMGTHTELISTLL
jgi:hypothetical protein